MKAFVTAAVLALVVGSQAQGRDPAPFAGVVPLKLDSPNTNHSHRGLTGRAVVFDSRSGDALPAVTRLHPVIGSTQRAGHKKYSATMYNPVLGSFGSQTFRR